jgi:hypothetical protein
MNKIIKNQLLKCKVADIPSFEEDTTYIEIPKGKRFNKSLSFELNKCYIIEIEDYVLNPSPEFTLSTNWNRGTVPPNKYMKVMVSQIMGKMIKVIGNSYDYNNHTDLNFIWEGWLPSAAVKLLHVI